MQSISVKKLASLIDLDEATLRGQLSLLKKTAACVTWTGGDLSSGTPQPCGDLDFSLEKDPATGDDMVVVVEPKVQRRNVGEFLVRHITKFEEIVRDLEAIPTTKAPEPVAAF